MQLNALINPLKLSVAISVVSLLSACSGNSSSSSSGPAAIIDPIEVDKTMAEVEWTAENYVTNASHAYRVATQNSMLRLVFTNQLAAFDALVNLLRVDSNRNCLNSGRMIAESELEKCFTDAFDGTETPCVEDSVLRKSEQVSRALECQDGSTSGKYFDGFFSTTQTEDRLADPSVRKTSTVITALGETTQFDDDGKLIVDEHGDPIMKQLTDYLFQSDVSRFFFDHNYESYVDFSNTKLVCGDNEYITVDKQGIRSAEVGTLEGGGSSNTYLYTQLTNLDLQAVPVETCGEDDKQEVSYTYNLTANMANAAMGGGTRNTLVTWPDMDINLAGIPSGTITLVHENEAGPYDTVTVNFTVDGDDNVSAIISDTNTTTTLPLAEFFALSKPPAEE